MFMGGLMLWVNTDSSNVLTHRGLVTPYGDIELSQHWLRQWLVAWQCQTIIWTNSDNHLRVILEEIPQTRITDIS